VEKILEEVIRQYEEKIENCAELGVDFSEIERVVLLKNVDNKWIDNIDAMDQLRRGISLRSYAQENPINAYKKEGMEMFDEMIYNIRHDTLRVLLKIKVNVEQRQNLEKETERTQVANDLTTVGGSDGRQPFVKKEVTIGRNDPCPCGSGKKYKNCCGNK
jgi:preprotein translocase subunit SecA